MRLCAFLLAITIGAISSPPTLARADDSTSCIEPRLADTLSLTYHLDETALIPPGSNRETELCNPASKLARLLDFLEKLDTLELPAFSGGFIRDPYKTFVASQSTSITLDRNNHCGGGDGQACHDLHKSPLWLMDDYFQDSDVSWIQKVSTLIHESRHAQGFDHYNCTRGPIADRKIKGPYCDQTFDDGGSYSVEAEFYARMALMNSNLHPSETALARREALLTLDTFVNEPVNFNEKSILLLRDKNSGQVYAFDGSDPSEVDGLKLGSTLNPDFMDLVDTDTVMLEDSSTSELQVLSAKEGLSPASLLNTAASQSILGNSFLKYDQMTGKDPIRSTLFRAPYFIILRSSAIDVWQMPEKPSDATTQIPVDFGTFSSGYDTVRISPFSPSGTKGNFIILKDKVSWQLTTVELHFGHRDDGSVAARIVPLDPNDPTQEALWPETVVKVFDFQGRLYRLNTDGSLEIQNSDLSWSVPDSISSMHFSGAKVVRYSAQLSEILKRSENAPKVSPNKSKSRGAL